MEAQIANIIRDYQTTYGIEMVRQPKVCSFGDIDYCKEAFIAAFKAVDKTIGQFRWLKEYDEVISWLNNTEGKGLLLSGSVGTGKSIIITGVLPILMKLKFRKFLHCYSAYEISSKEEEILKLPYVCIDDVGCEPVANHYGEKKEVFCELIDNAEKYLKPVYISTNLSGEDFDARYGSRTSDRISRLCKMIKIDSVSMR